MRQRACGVLIRNGKVLLQRKRDEAIWALPGGRVEAGETPEAALAREWMEELGCKPSICRLLWVFENRFEHQGVGVEQTEFFFEVDAALGLDVAQPVDGSLMFAWASLSDLTRIDVRPVVIRDRLFARKARHATA
jgi:8-oxo-dGTP pyrophosphatase MutT (NUDIX family)